MVDPGDVQDAKSRQRSALRAILANMSPTECDEASAAICQAVEARLGPRLDAGFMGYIPMPGEPDVHSLLGTRSCNAGARSARPVSTGTPEPWHLLVSPGCQVMISWRDAMVSWNPARANQLNWPACQIVLVPGLGFDEQGYRIGRGRRVLRPVSPEPAPGNIHRRDRL